MANENNPQEFLDLPNDQPSKTLGLNKNLFTKLKLLHFMQCVANLHNFFCQN